MREWHSACTMKHMVRGHECYLSVRRTILANPPADASDRTYSLIRILEDRIVTEPEVPFDEEITSEENIKHHDLCPFKKYAVSKSLPRSMRNLIRNLSLIYSYFNSVFF